MVNLTLVDNDDNWTIVQTNPMDFSNTEFFPTSEEYIKAQNDHKSLVSTEMSCNQVMVEELENEMAAAISSIIEVARPIQVNVPDAEIESSQMKIPKIKMRKVVKPKVETITAPGSVENAPKKRKVKTPEESETENASKAVKAESPPLKKAKKESVSKKVKTENAPPKKEKTEGAPSKKVKKESVPKTLKTEDVPSRKVKTEKSENGHPDDTLVKTPMAKKSRAKPKKTNVAVENPETAVDKKKVSAVKRKPVRAGTINIVPGLIGGYSTCGSDDSDTDDETKTNTLCKDVNSDEQFYLVLENGKVINKTRLLLKRSIHYYFKISGSTLDMNFNPGHFKKYTVFFRYDFKNSCVMVEIVPSSDTFLEIGDSCGELVNSN